MNLLSEKGITWVIRFGVVLLFSLIGHSLTRLEGISPDDGIKFALVGAIFASIAVFIGALLRPTTRQLEQSRPSKHFSGLKIGVVGFFIALSGWLVAIYIHGKIGFGLAVIGMLSGVFGVLVHFYYMFGGSKMHNKANHSEVKTFAPSSLRFCLWCLRR